MAAIAVCYEVNNDATSVGYTAHSLGTVQAAKDAGSVIPDVWVLTSERLTDANRARLEAAYAGVKIYDAHADVVRARADGVCFADFRKDGDAGRQDVLMLRLLMPTMPWAREYDVQVHIDGDTEVVDGAAFAGLAKRLDGYHDVAGVVEKEVARARFMRAVATQPNIPTYPALWNVAAGHYMNAGVYALDLERVRRRGSTDWYETVRAMAELARDIRSTMPDQDAMNLLLHILPVPCAYNAFAETGWKDGDEAYIRHYPGVHKGELNRKMCPTIE